MVKFKRYDGFGQTAITINGVMKLVQPNEVIDVDIKDECYDYLINSNNWSMVSEEVKKEPVIVKKEITQKIISINDLTRIKGIGHSSAELILNNEKLTWNDLKLKGLEYYKELLKDDIALILWNKINEEVN